MCSDSINCVLPTVDVEEDEEGCITSFTITPLQPVFKGARTYKLGAPTEAVSATQHIGLRSKYTGHLLYNSYSPHTYTPGSASPSCSPNVLCVVLYFTCFPLTSIDLQCLKDWCQALQDVGHVCRAYSGSSVSLSYIDECLMLVCIVILK